MSYDGPNSTVRREAMPGEAGGAATTEYLKFRTFQKAKLKKAHAVVTVVGTTTGHGFNVFHGTTSVGTIVLGTSAAETKVSSGLLDREVATMEQMSVKSLADATGKAHIVYEFDVLPDAVQS